MNRWDRQFKQHPIHETIKAAFKLISREPISGEAQLERRRLSKLLNLFEETLAKLEPELASYSILDHINSAIRSPNIWTALKNYNVSGNYSHLKSVNEPLYNILITPLSQLLAIAKSSEPIEVLEKQLKEFEKELSSKKETLENEFNKISVLIKKAEVENKKIQELHGIVAGNSVAFSYSKNAKDEKKQANFWRWVTMGVIALTVIWGGCTYADIGIVSSGEMLWGKILKGFSITGILLFGAVYSAKQSNLHRENEKQERWFELRVTAIDPFISSLSKEDQSKLKFKLADHLFAQSHSNKEASIADEGAFKTFIKGNTDILKLK